MNEKFQNKYRIESMRLQNWDYRWAGSYFITICTKDRAHYFGEVLDGRMQLSNVGVLADVFWHDIKIHTKYLELGEFVVMPNHVHGILIIKPHSKETRHALSQTEALPQPEEQSPQSNPKETIGQLRFQNQGKNSISSIVGSYKAAVTKHSNRLELPFAWQSGFYENIIRDQQAFENISKYIINNPKNWKEDKFSIDQ